MQFLTVIVLGFLYNIQVSGQNKIDVVKAFQQACPYTNFCSHNASQTIIDDSQTPCCRDCSCADDCWRRDNCCPDKVINGDELKSEQETCRSTTVKESVNNVLTTNGLDIDGKRYFVIEACSATTNDNLKRKCIGIAMETFAEIIWVSDAKTNKVYKNRFCAECNGVRKYKKWYLSTSCADFMSIQNYSQAVSAFPKHCTLTVSPPDRKTEDNRCLIPDISTCNATGLWQIKDSVTESLCESHPLMFIHDTVYSTLIYRNAFCYKCNSAPMVHLEDICEDVFRTRRSRPSSFTAIFNIFEEEDKSQTKKQCQVEEVKDTLKRSCLKLLCPEGQFARYGSCQKIFSEIYFLGITIIYRLRPNWNKLKYGTKASEEYNIADLGKAIRRQIYHDLNLGECGRCYGTFITSNTEETIGNAQIPLFLEFSPMFYTYGKKCEDTTIVDAMSAIIGKELTVYLDEEEYVTFDIQESEHASDSMGNVSQVYLGAHENDDGFCGTRHVKSHHDLNRCPMVTLDNSYNQHLMKLAHTAAQKSRVKSLFVVDGDPNEPMTQMNTSSVCWENYRKLVFSLTSSSRKFTVDAVFTMITGFVSIILY